MRMFENAKDPSHKIVLFKVAFSHGDIQYAEKMRAGIVTNETIIPCVTEIKGYHSALLFSIETQHTIGRIWNNVEKILFIYNFFLFNSRLRKSIYHRRMSRSDFHHVYSVHYGCIHSSIYGWHCFCQIS